MWARHRTRAHPAYPAAGMYEHGHACRAQQAPTRTPIEGDRRGASLALRLPPPLEDVGAAHVCCTAAKDPCLFDWGAIMGPCPLVDTASCVYACS